MLVAVLQRLLCKRSAAAGIGPLLGCPHLNIFVHSIEQLFALTLREVDEIV